MGEATYSTDGVRRLLGLYEEPTADGRRHLVLLDILSWARDPGGMHLVSEMDPEPWMAIRGPLHPESAVAAILWDFASAMRRLREDRALSIKQEAAVALQVFGFSFREIAEALGVQPSTVSRWLLGREKRDEDGQVVKAVRRGKPRVVRDTRTSLPWKIARAMNGEGP